MITEIEEKFMAFCITRMMKCKPSDCVKCAWLRDETKAKLELWIKEEQKALSDNSAPTSKEE